MLIKITTDQIAREWKVIKYALEKGLPPIVDGAPVDTSKILYSLMMDEMQCWCSLTKDGLLQAVVITMITSDGVSAVHNLLIYCMYSFNPVDRQSFVAGLAVLKRYASSRGCHRLVAYTAVQGIIDLFHRIGGDTRYRFVSLNVGGADETS